MGSSWNSTAEVPGIALVSDMKQAVALRQRQDSSQNKTTVGGGGGKHGWGGGKHNLRGWEETKNMTWKEWAGKNLGGRMKGGITTAVMWAACSGRP